MTVRTIDDIFRDFVTDGVPASGPFNPHKPDIRDTLKALTEGSENFPDNRVIRLNNADEGTANNIVVTASVAIPAAAYQVLYILNVTQENTGSVTVSGAINRNLVTNINQPVPAGYLTPGMALLCIDTGTELRLLSYGDAEAIVAEAESILNDLIARSVGAFASDADAEQYLADRSLSAGVGTIYFNTTDNTWKYWDGTGWQAFPYATVADGSVTDAKLPDYNSSTSPSASKLRYQASTSSGAMAGAIQRPVQLKLSERLDAADFGVKADGTTNDTVAMSAALRAAELYGRPLFLPSGTILVDADALFIGNGAEGTNSSYNNQTIIGIGSSPAFASGTIIKSRTNGTCLFDIRGLVSGVSISGVTFDCDSKVQIGIRIRSMSESNIEQFAVRNFTSIGIDWNCRANPSGSPTWSSGNVIKQFYITSSSVVAFGVGLLLDGQISTNKDPHRNTFHTGIIQINKAASNPTFAMLLAMTDSNTFIEVDADTIGTGLGFGVRFSALTSNGFPFPQNNFFYGCSIKGIDVAEDAGTGKLIGQNVLVNMTTMDGETLPTHPKILGFTDTGKFFNDITVDKNVPALELRSRDGLKRYRLINNSNDSTDGGVLLQKWNTSTSDWVTYFAVDSAGTPAITLPGLGLKQVQAGAVDTGGTGFRRLVVSN